jgi:hypothetical protein
MEVSIQHQRYGIVDTPLRWVFLKEIQVFWRNGIWELHEINNQRTWNFISQLFIELNFEICG